MCKMEFNGMYLQLAGAEDRLGGKILSTAASLQLESGLILLTFIRDLLSTDQFYVLCPYLGGLVDWVSVWVNLRAAQVIFLVQFIFSHKCHDSIRAATFILSLFLFFFFSHRSFNRALTAARLVSARTPVCYHGCTPLLSLFAQALLT